MHLHYLMEKLIKTGHLKQYVRTTSGHEEMAREAPKMTFISLATYQVVINNIHGGPVNDKYHSK